MYKLMDFAIGVSLFIGSIALAIIAVAFAIAMIKCGFGC